MKHITKTLKLISTIIISFGFLLADPKGEEIAKKASNLKEANDSSSIAIMRLIDKRGKKSDRKLKIVSLRTSEGINNYMEFLAPSDVKGVKFLTIAHKKGADEQRLYLPEFKKIRRIQAAGKKGKFQGSDLTYYDMEDHNVDDSIHTYLNDDVLTFGKGDKKKTVACFVIKSVSKKSDTPYGKTKIWIGKNNYFTYKIECYDKSQRLLKTIEIKKIKTINGVIVPMLTKVYSIKDQHKTYLVMLDVKINSGVSRSFFSIKNLAK